MTRKTIYGGLIILIVFTALVAVGIFLMQRYNGIANAEGKIQEIITNIDSTSKNQKSGTEKLLTATESLKDTTEYTNVATKEVSLETNPTAFFKDDSTFQKNLSVYLDTVATNETLSKDSNVSTLLGQIQSDQADLRNQKSAYNSAVDTYNTKRNARPQFFGQLLGFVEYQKFSNVTAPLDATPDQNETDEENQTPDSNSFN